MDFFISHITSISTTICVLVVVVAFLLSLTNKRIKLETKHFVSLVAIYGSTNLLVKSIFFFLFCNFGYLPDNLKEHTFVFSLMAICGIACSTISFIGLFSPFISSKKSEEQDDIKEEEEVESVIHSTDS